MLAHLAVLTPRDHLRRRARDRRHGRRGVPVHRRRRRRAPLQAPRRRVRARRPSRAIIELRLGFIAERASVGGRLALEAGASQRGCRRRRLSIARGSRRRRHRGRCRRRRIHADPRPLSQDRGSLQGGEKHSGTESTKPRRRDRPRRRPQGSARIQRTDARSRRRRQRRRRRRTRAPIR